MLPIPNSSFARACYTIAALILSSQEAAATPDQIAHLSIYFLDRAILKTNADHLLLEDGRSLAIERGRLIVPQSRVTTSWNDFYRRSEDPPSSDLRVRLSVRTNKEIIICLAEQCANVIHVCPPRKNNPNGQCLRPQSITNLQEVK